MRIDLHVHTKYSKCSLMKPEKIVKIAIKKGLDGFAITDHNTMKGILKIKVDEITIIPGEEIKTELGEVIGLFLQEEIKPRSFEEVLEKIREQDGLAVIPHPFDRFRRFKDKEKFKAVDAIEAFNSRVTFFSDNLKAKEFAWKNRVPMTAGSDAHFYWEIGKAYIEVEDLENLKKEILERKIKIFCKKSNILNHALTKVVKAWKRI
jgi:hypothetical protein